MGTLDRNYVYIGRTTKRGYRNLYKIGYSKNPKVRWKFIDKSVPGSKEYFIFAGRTFLAGHLEQYLLSITAHRKVDFMGSGYTEWRKYSIFPFLPFFIIAGCSFLTWFRIPFFVIVCLAGTGLYSLGPDRFFELVKEAGKIIFFANFS